MSRKLVAHNTPAKKSKSHDRTLLVTLLGLSLFGFIAVFNASAVTAFRDFGDQYHFVKDHGVYVIAGFVALFTISKIDYRKWYGLSIPLLVGILILLLAVFIPGIGVYALGARRWIDLGFFSLQPTELAKLTLIIYLSAWFSTKEKGRLAPFLVLIGIVLGLVLLQPDLGTAVIITTIAGILYFISGAPLLHFLALIPVGLVGVALLAIAAPYRLARVTTFLNPSADPLGSSYHIRQILIALGSGGWFGLGLGKSRQKYDYLPEANTDSIFAIIAEEVGFLGAILLIATYAFLVYKAFVIAKRAPDRFGFLLASGIGIWFAIQVLINLGSMVALIPLTGVPLPLISSGGSHIVSTLLGFGILLNIAKQGTIKKHP